MLINLRLTLLLTIKNFFFMKIFRSNYLKKANSILLLRFVLLFTVGTIFVACSSTDEKFKETSIDSKLRKDFLEGKILMRLKIILMN